MDRESALGLSVGLARVDLLDPLAISSDICNALFRLLYSLFAFSIFENDVVPAAHNIRNGIRASPVYGDPWHLLAFFGTARFFFNLLVLSLLD